MLGIPQVGADAAMSAEDLICSLERYRCVSRDLWNKAFLPSSSARIDLFSQIDALLYKSIVEWTIDPEDCEKALGLPLWFSLRSGAEILTGEPRSGVIQWEKHPEGSRNAVLQFEAFFDWDEHSERSREMVRASVRLSENKALIGKLVLCCWNDVERVVVAQADGGRV
jgi:hypothetical protein